MSSYMFFLHDFQLTQRTERALRRVQCSADVGQENRSHTGGRKSTIIFPLYLHQRTKFLQNEHKLSNSRRNSPIYNKEIESVFKTLEKSLKARMVSPANSNSIQCLLEKKTLPNTYYEANITVKPKSKTQQKTTANILHKRRCKNSSIKVFTFIYNNILCLITVSTLCWQEPREQ